MTLNLSIGVEGSDEEGWHVVVDGLPEGPVRTPYVLASRAAAEAEARQIGKDAVEELRSRGLMGGLRVRETWHREGVPT